VSELAAYVQLGFHHITDLRGADVVILPGGFSYGDYLRAGAIARFSPIMQAVQQHAARGVAVGEMKADGIEYDERMALLDEVTWPRPLADLLEARGVDVKYAIHPVAGRMPGHMNVLLAEAQVPYPQLYDMDDINPEFPRTDVALVIGANDVTNPAARDNPESPLYGMPILNVDQAANVVILKRSMSPGFAGIDNDLFYEGNSAMLFGDAKSSVEKLVAAVKAA